MSPLRKLSPYEKNQLYKYGFQTDNPGAYGQKPVEYITNHVEFCDQDFFVNESVLIPRIESEELVKHTVSYITNKFSKSKEITIADIGCGSGCLGIAITRKLLDNNYQKVSLILSDISTDALGIASINQKNLLPSFVEVSLIKSDLLSQHDSARKIDVLVSNLPYIPSQRISTLDPSVKDYEPTLALDGGIDGAVIINRLLDQMANYLSPQYFAIFEIDHIHQISSFHIPKNSSTTIIKDNFNNNRFLVITP